MAECPGRSPTVAALPMRNVKAEVDRTDLEVYADPLFEKVSYNLIDNALRYGGDRLTRFVSRRRRPESGWSYAMKTTGPGSAQAIKSISSSGALGKIPASGYSSPVRSYRSPVLPSPKPANRGDGAPFEIAVPKGEFPGLVHLEPSPGKWKGTYRTHVTLQVL